MHCLPGTVLGSGDRDMDRSLFALKGVLDLVEKIKSF
jgi:hypothetical protein